MFPYISVSVAVVGSALAGAFDLKTTEIPDEISLGMVAAGLIINFTWSIVEWNPVHIFRSASIGSAFFTFGLVMYMAGQWGGGDAKVLTGIGTLIPSAPVFAAQTHPFPFSAVIMINTFLIGAVYMLIYALGISIRKGDVVDDFMSRASSDWKRIVAISSLPIIIALASVAAVGWGTYVFYFLMLAPAVALLLLLLRFLKAVEDTGFTKKIDVDKLRVGDMLAEEIEEIDATHDPIEELKGLSKFLMGFGILPLTMYAFGFTEGLYFYLSFPAPILGVMIGFIYLLYSRSFEIFGSVFNQSSTRIRGLEEEEVGKIRENYKTVTIREGVRFAPVFPIAIAVTVYYGNVLMLLF